MNHYRISPEVSGLPFPALAVPEDDLALFGETHALGFEKGADLMSGERPIPHVPFALDLHDERSVGIHSTQIDVRSGALVRYDFPDEHRAWADQIHRDGQAILCVTSQDFMSFATSKEALRESRFGRVTLVVRATDDGVGTRRAGA